MNPIKGNGCAAPLAKVSAAHPIQSDNGLSNSGIIPHCENKRLEVARRRWIGANQWAKDNPDAWRFMVNLAKSETRLKRKFGVRWAMEEMRKKSFVGVEGKLSTVTNDFNPAFGRMMVRDYPEMKPYLRLHKSEIDEIL